MINKFTGFFSLILVFFAGWVLQSCKKSAPAAPANSYFLNATINGNAFTTSSVGIASESNVSVLVGLKVNGLDSTMVVLAFPSDEKSNKQYLFDAADTTILAYRKTKPKIDEYTSDSTTLKGQGAFTITSSSNDSIVAGTFSGKVIDSIGTVVNITNGSFRSRKIRLPITAALINTGGRGLIKGFDFRHSQPLKLTN